MLQRASQTPLPSTGAQSTGQRVRYPCVASPWLSLAQVGASHGGLAALLALNRRLASADAHLAGRIAALERLRGKPRDGVQPQ